MLNKIQTVLLRKIIKLNPNLTKDEVITKALELLWITNINSSCSESNTKCDITSIKSLREYGIGVTADGYYLLDAERRVKETGALFAKDLKRILSKVNKEDK